MSTTTERDGAVAVNVVTVHGTDVSLRASASRDSTVTVRLVPYVQLSS